MGMRKIAEKSGMFNLGAPQLSMAGIGAGELFKKRSDDNDDEFTGSLWKELAEKDHGYLKYGIIFGDKVGGGIKPDVPYEVKFKEEFMQPDEVDELKIKRKYKELSKMLKKEN